MAASSLAILIGLAAMISGRGLNTAQDADDRRTGTSAQEVVRVEPQLVAREGRTDRVEAAKPSAETKSDRLLEETAMVRAPTLTETILVSAPALAGETLLSEPRQLAPWLGEDAAAWAALSGPSNLAATGDPGAVPGSAARALKGAVGRATNAHAGRGAGTAGGGGAGKAGTGLGL